MRRQNTQSLSSRREVRLSNTNRPRRRRIPVAPEEREGSWAVTVGDDGSISFNASVVGMTGFAHQKKLCKLG